MRSFGVDQLEPIGSALSGIETAQQRITPQPDQTLRQEVTMALEVIVNRLSVIEEALRRQTAQKASKGEWRDFLEEVYRDLFAPPQPVSGVTEEQLASLSNEVNNRLARMEQAILQLAGNSSNTEGEVTSVPQESQAPTHLQEEAAQKRKRHAQP